MRVESKRSASWNMYFVADAAREEDVLKPELRNVVMPPVSVSQTSPGTVLSTFVRPLDWRRLTSL